MQHVEEAAHLGHVRSLYLRAPDVRLLHLGRLDERLAAHLDGVAVAGVYGRRLADRALERLGGGEIFVATVRALEEGDANRVDQLLAITQTVSSVRPGLLAAFGWVSASSLRGIVMPLLERAPPWPREVALASCAMHAVNPGFSVTRALEADDERLRARALRFAGQCGRRELIGNCRAALADTDEYCAFEAARSALLLGDRSNSLLSLEALAVGNVRVSPTNDAALRVLLKVVSAKTARAILASLAKDPAQIRSVIRGIAMAGDPHYVPWLMAQMEDPKLARLAGEAFSFITGVDPAYLDLEGQPLQDFGPSADPNDQKVSMDEDDSLPWPDRAKLHAWWKQNGSRFKPGIRYFIGDQPTSQKCLEVLQTGFQRQRIAAAEYRALLNPGTPVFNVTAPSWRQRRLLAQITA